MKPHWCSLVGVPDRIGRPSITVLNVLHELRPSGAETMLAAAANRWVAHGVSARILALAPEKGPYAPVLEGAGYEVASAWRNSHVGLVREFKAELRRSPVDVVHLHTEWANFWLATA